MMGKSSKSVIVVLVLLIALVVLVNTCNNKTRNKKISPKSQNIEQVKTPDIEQVKTPEELRVEQLQREQQRLEKVEERKQRVQNEQKQLLEAEIELFNEPFDASNLSRYTVGEMNYFVATFKTRAKMIRTGENSNNVEIIELAKKLKTKVVAYQIKAFPILRKAYATGLNKKLWAVDGKAYVSGNSNIYITVVSPELVLNKMKLEAHKAICSTLNSVRFRQARYKYYDGSDYTGWTVFEGKDADLVE